MAKYGHTKNLVEYFKKNIQKGYDEETLRWALINQGYSRVEIQKATEQAHQEIEEEKTSSNIGSTKEKPKIKYEILDEENQPIHSQYSESKKPFWKRWFGF